MKNAGWVLVALMLMFVCVGAGYGQMEYPNLYDAAANGELADVARHLQRGANVNAKGQDGDTPLMAAAEAGASFASAAPQCPQKLPPADSWEHAGQMTRPSAAATKTRSPTAASESRFLMTFDLMEWAVPR